MLNTAKSIIIASIILAITISLNCYYSRQDTSCVSLFNGLGDSHYTTAPLVDLYIKGQLNDDYAKGIEFAERMHGVAVKQCMER